MEELEIRATDGCAPELQLGCAVTADGDAELVCESRSAIVGDLNRAVVFPPPDPAELVRLGAPAGGDDASVGSGWPEAIVERLSSFLDLGFSV